MCLRNFAVSCWVRGLIIYGRGDGVRGAAGGCVDALENNNKPPLPDATGCVLAVEMPALCCGETLRPDIPASNSCILGVIGLAGALSIALVNSSIMAAVVGLA